MSGRYVDNSYNRSLGRVGKNYGKAMGSIDVGTSDSEEFESLEVNYQSENDRTYDGISEDKLHSRLSDAVVPDHQAAQLGARNTRRDFFRSQQVFANRVHHWDTIHCGSIIFGIPPTSRHDSMKERERKVAILIGHVQQIVSIR